MRQIAEVASRALTTPHKESASLTATVRGERA